MFVPPIPKPKAATPTRATAAREASPHVGATVREHVGDAARGADQQQATSWGFSRVPVLSGGRAEASRPLPHAIQAKLDVGAVDDPLEQEADTIADQVMQASGSEARVGGISAHVSRAAGGGVAPASVHEVLRSSGQPLDSATRSYFEPRFGHDFSDVRVHANDTAAASARDVSARAYTAGSNIVFGAGRFAPATDDGRRLIAHELTHVVQQTGVEGTGTAAAILQRDPDPRGQEAERAAGEMWGLIKDINEIGAEVEFVYYTNAGAMTLVSYKLLKPGNGAGASISLDSFRVSSLGFKGGAAVGSVLVTIVGTGERYLKLTLKRETRKWGVDSWGEANDKNLPSTPPEGRTQLSAASAGWPLEVFERVQKAVAAWVPVLKTYAPGTAALQMAAEFDDERLMKLNLVSQTNTGGKGPAFAPADAGTQLTLTNTLLAFTQGLGKRTIAFKLEGDASSGVTKWRVREAATDRGPPPPMPDEAAVIVADYHRMHEEIIRRWREGVKDAAIYAGMMGAEQLAFWLIGGVVAKGFGAVVELAAPRLLGFIRVGSKGGSRAGIEYLETTIARLPMAERAEMQVLARKVETEGIEALGKAERQSLERLLKKLEDLIEAPLAQAEKDTLRGRMATRFGAAKPGVNGLFQAANRSYQIHHRMPLEWAHRFPGVDANAGKNLIALETEVHQGVNAIWTRLRNTAPAAKVDGNVVSRVMDIIDKNFGKWYDVVPSSTGAKLEAEVLTSKGAALDELAALVSKL